MAASREGGYRALLSVPGVGRLYVSSLVARVPLGITSLAILLLTRHETGSFAPAGAATGAYSLTSAACAPVWGRLVDRLGQWRVLIPVATAQSLLLVAFVIAAVGGVPPAPLVAIAAVAGGLLPPIAACLRSLWSTALTDLRVRETGYALDATLQGLVWVAGPIAVAVAVSAGSPAAAVLLSAALTLGGTVWFATSPMSRDSVGHEIRRRTRSALSSRPLRVVLVAVTLFGCHTGSLEVALPALLQKFGSNGTSGLVIATWAVGNLVGGLAYGSRRWSSSLARRHVVLFAVVAVCAAPLLLATSTWQAFALSLLVGLPGAGVLSCQYALVGALAPEGTVAEAFTWCTAALALGIAAGSAAAGPLASVDALWIAFVIGSVAPALGVPVGMLVRPRREPNGSFAA